MRKQITKVLFVLMMGMMFVASAFAQGAGGHSYGASVIEGDWETFHFPNLDAEGNVISGSFTDVKYYIGGYYDRFAVNRNLGTFWKGTPLEELSANEEIYLCNVKTGEYLQVGDYWGESSMTNYAGIEYVLESGKMIRKKQGWGKFANDEDGGYWIVPHLDGIASDRCIGRMHAGDGTHGHFEHNRYLALRCKDEYNDGKYYDGTNISTNGDLRASNGVNPGGFLFKFHRVNYDDQICYLIYTHRKTDYANDANADNRRRSEYNDRDSYLLLRSAGSIGAGYNAVRFKKFAGQMRGEGTSVERGIKLTFAREGQQANVSVTDMTGSAISGVTATLVSTSFGDLMTSGASAITRGIVLAPASYGNVANSEITYTFLVQNLPSNNRTFNSAKLDVYSMKSSGEVQSRMDRNFQFFVKTGAAESSVESFGSTGDINLTREPATPNENWGLYHGIQTLTVGRSATAGNDFYIKVTLKKTSSEGCYAGIGEVILYNSADTYTWYDSIEDEKDYSDAEVSLQIGLDNEDGKPENLWKIVTKKERERYRLVASEEKPIDMTYRIKNPKFYTSYNYVWSKSEASWSEEHNHWHHENGDTPFGWQWYNDDRQPHLSPDHHVHPYDLTTGDNGFVDYNLDPMPAKGELHKVGTGFPYRYMAKGVGADRNEFMITQGIESNYVGSIFKGTSNIQQKVGTAENPLREGMYLVGVKGFFAPHDMEKYTQANGILYCDGTEISNGSNPLTTEDAWYKEAKVTSGADAGKWRRSHDSYLFAWSCPEDENEVVEVRRMLPSIYEGAVRLNQINAISNTLSREDFINGTEFKYTQLGEYYVKSDPSTESQKIKYLKDSVNLAKYNGGFFPGGNKNLNWVVPKTLIGAGRYFNAVEGAMALDKNDNTKTSYRDNVPRYHIVLPVYVGSNGILTIGVDHTRIPTEVTFEKDGKTVTIPASGDDEWVCFDDFELIYLGKQELDDFVIDEWHAAKDKNKKDFTVGPYKVIDGKTGEATEVEFETQKGSGIKDIPQRNNSQWHDIFGRSDIMNHGKTDKILKNIYIRRTMTKGGWNSIVLPVSLTQKHVKQAFGEETQVSRLADFTGRTIKYKLQNPAGTGDDAVVIKAGVPYIIKPSEDPMIQTTDKYIRPKFTVAMSTQTTDRVGYCMRDSLRNYEVEWEMAGPIYVASDVYITSGETFPGVEFDGGPGTYTPRVGGDSIRLADIDVFDSYEDSLKYYTYRKAPSDKEYVLREYATYYYNGIASDGTGGIPAYSYYWSGGKVYYTTKDLNTSRGMYSYFQLIESGTENNAKPVPFTSQFFDSGDFAVKYVENDPVVTGIEDVNNPLPEPDGRMEIYDLQGRKVKNVSKGLYIVNGVKVLFQ